MRGRFVDKVVLVTGAASGIGAALARRCGAEGAAIVALDRDGDALERFAASCRSDGVTVLDIVGDVTDEAAMAVAVADGVTQMGGLDVLANVAGAGFYRSLPDTSVEEFERILRINLLGPFILSQQCAPHLAARDGCIVNVASAAGLNGRTHLSAYSSTKGGLVALTRSLAVELAPQVRVNAVCPGGVDTPLLEQFRVPDDVDPERLGRHPSLVGRRSTPEEIAAACAHLASDEAASTTGSILLVDGGCAA